MRVAAWLGAASAVVVGFAGAAQAQELEIEHAAARVVVIPEARSDVSVTITPGSPELPQLEVRRRGASVEIDGDLRNRIRECSLSGVGVVRNTGTPLQPDRQLSVEIRGIGRVRAADLPLITARVPMNAKVGVSGAVFGSVGRSQALSLSNAGCGDWTVANVGGPLEISIAGSGDVSAGSARTASVSIAGSGDVRIGDLAGDLNASVAGSGDVRVASVRGRVDASIAGSGDVNVDSGRVGEVDASIAGSGDVRIEAVASSLDASIVGSGDVRVAQVTGQVEHSILGSGEVVVADRRIGRRNR